MASWIKCTALGDSCDLYVNLDNVVGIAKKGAGAILTFAAGYPNSSGAGSLYVEECPEQLLAGQVVATIPG